MPPCSMCRSTRSTSTWRPISISGACSDTTSRSAMGSATFATRSRSRARLRKKRFASARRRSTGNRPCATRSQTPGESRRTSSTSRGRTRRPQPMPAGEIYCLLTKGLIPYVEHAVGAEGVAALLRVAGRSREYLMAEYNSIPLPLADQFIRMVMELMGEPDEDSWARRFADDFMDWKPSREERSWMGAYTMSLGSPRALYAKRELMTERGWGTMERLVFKRRRAIFRVAPNPGVRVPRWLCTWLRVCYERFPTNWGLPRAIITEHKCAARGDDVCEWEIRWKNPPLGARFWVPTLAGVIAAALGVTLGAAEAWPWLTTAALAVLPALCGTTLGWALLQHRRSRHFQRLLEVQAHEILYSSRELEKKFSDLETKVEQLSLLSELSAAVNSTLDVEKIYDQALERLVHSMRCDRAYLFLVDHGRGLLRGHRVAGAKPGDPSFEGLGLPLDAPGSANARAAMPGLAVMINDVDAAGEGVHMPSARAHHVRALVSVPLRVKERVFGVLSVTAREPDRFAATDVELLSAVANHVALAVDRAESFQTIEELSRGLEDKVRVRTDQLRAAHDE